MKWLFIAAFLAVSCSVMVASAQYPVPYYAMGSNNYHHASTVEEGAARGLADVIRSTGAANLMNSEALKNVEDARKKNIENRLQWTNTYFEMKAVNKQARFGNQQRPSQQDLIRYSKARLPDRLQANQVDPLKGTLRWPTVLQLPDFKDDREALEGLFAERAKNGYVGPREFQQIQALTAQMKNELRTHANEFPSGLIIDARKFLESLAYEAQFQAG